MSRQGTAWSVKGVDQATRDIARRASQSAGLTIGEWIDQAIRADAAARGEPVPDAGGDYAPGGHGAPATGRVSLGTVDALAARLDAADARFDAAMRPVAYALQDIAERLVALERRQAEQALTPPARGDEVRERRPALPDRRAALPDAGRSGMERRQPADELPAEPGYGGFEAPGPQNAEPQAAESPVAGSQDVAPRHAEPRDAEPGDAEPGGSVTAAMAAAPETRRRRLPDAPPEDWEPVVWIRRTDLAREAEAMRSGERQAAADMPPSPAELPPVPAAQPVAAPLLDADTDAIRFDEPADTAEQPLPDDEAAADLPEPAPATRPEPTPPAGDMPVEGDLGDTVPAWLTRATPETQPERPQPETQSGARAAVEPEPPTPRFEQQARKRRSPPLKRRWPAAAAAVVLLVGGTAAWWFATGGGVPNAQALQGRLAVSAERAMSGVENAYRMAAGEFGAWRERLFPATPEPEPPVAEAPPRSAVVTAPPAADPQEPGTRKPEPPSADGSREEAPTPAPEPAATPAPAQETAPSAPLAAAPEPAPNRPRASVPAAPPTATPPVSAPSVTAPPVTAPPVTVQPQPPAPAAAPASAPPASRERPAPPPAPVLAPASPDPAPDRQAAVLPPSAAAPAEPDTADLLADARRGDPRAQYLLATRLAAAPEPDFTQAANWFREAAIQGVANAQYNLGVQYERALGVPQDDTRALLWYHSAAEQGHPLAQYNLGVLYSSGRGIPLSYVEASRWFERAAAQGVPAAIYNLSVLTEGGLGVARDPAEAERLLRRAAELGHPKARERLRAGGASADAATMDETASTSAEAAAAEDVVAIQRGLARLGLYDGPVDGIAGPRTRDAISRYQRREGLPVTGLPSNALKQRLNPQDSTG